MKLDLDNKLIAERLLVALDLMEFGIDIIRQNIKRKLKGESNEQINAELNRWLFEQPNNFVPKSSNTEKMSNMSK
jgi:hypothetical protein